MARAIGWTVVILLAVVPWTTYRTHSHWAKVVWIPFSAAPPVIDVIGNVLLYVPFGYLWAGASPRRMGGMAIVQAAVGLSVMTELSQVFAHSRFPSATDVVLNVVGAALGWLIWQRRMVDSPMRQG